MLRSMANLLSLICGVIALACVGFLYYGLISQGLSGGGGMALLVLQLYAVVSAGVAIILGLVDILVAKKTGAPCTFVGKIGMRLAMLSVLLLAIALYLFD